jgi:hypothetical protein
MCAYSRFRVHRERYGLMTMRGRLRGEEVGRMVMKDSMVRALEQVAHCRISYNG